MELKIYNQTGDLKLTVSPNTSSTVTEEVMGECAVSVGFTYTEFVMLDVNDYIEIEGVRYMNMSQYRPKQKNTQTYEYSVKFYAPIHQAENTLMLFTPDDEMTSEFAYDGGPREHLQLWIDNMNRIAGSNVWKIGTVITAENKVIEYKNVKCWDAAFGSNGIAAAFDTEMWADGYYINLCKAERGERVDLGYLQGLTSLQQEENGEVKFFTRLFPLGSTRNIDASKYGHARLQLPGGVQFVDKNVDIYGVKEEFEEEAFSKIYPKYIGTVQSVRTENLTNTEGRDYTVYYIKDAAIAFNPNDYEIPEYTKMIAFQSGELAGRGDDKGNFQANWHEDTKEWEIINTYPDDNTQIPGGVIIPNIGDRYIPWNFRMPDEYNTIAEQEFLAAVNDYLNEYSFDTNKYSGQTDRNHIENNNIKLMIGLNVRLQSDTYFAAGYKDTRITKVVRQLNDLCQATVTCTDKIGAGWKASVDNNINSLKYATKSLEQTIVDVIRTGELKTPSDNNVFSALKSLLMFFRKDKNEIIKFLTTFLGGAVFGKDGFAEGLLGFGAKIDENGYGEMRGLKLWESLTVPQINYNRVDVLVGDKWRSPGAGVIDTVTPDTDAEGNILSTGTAVLQLEEGEIGTIDVDDMNMGIWHFGDSRDATEDSDDGVGNFAFAGFATAYWRITEVSGENNNTFRYALRPGYDVHPQPQMKFSCRGNFTNPKRQTSVYETRTYTRMLVNQNTWEFGKQNIGLQYGDLSNLNIFGLDMTGYSMYLNSVYFTGIIKQVKPDGTPILTANDRGAWDKNIADKTGYDYYDRVSHNGSLWLCVNEKGSKTEPSKDNPDWLLQVEKGEDGSSGISNALVIGAGNQNIVLSADKNGNVVVGLPSTININAYLGNQSIDITRIELSNTTGITASVSGSTITVSKYSASADIVKFDANVVVTIEGVEYERLLSLSVTRVRAGEDGNVPPVYEIVPSDNVIKVDKDGNKTPQTVSAKIRKTDANGSEIVNSVSGYSIKYSIDGGSDAAYNTSIATTSIEQKITFKLYKGTELIDSEDIPVIYDGIDGQDGINGADGVDGTDGTSIIWKGSFSSHPKNPQDGWAYRNTTDKKSYVYQDGAWYQMTVDGVDGQNGEDGLSIVWKGDLQYPPSNPKENWVYRDTNNGRVYIYNGSAWELMVVDGSNGTDGANGQDGYSVYITYHDSETKPSKPTGNGTTGGWHTDGTQSSIWMSQKVAASASSGTWGDPIKIKGENGQDGADGENAIMYKLLPSVTSIKVSKSGDYTPTYVTTGLIKIDGEQVTKPTYIPSGYSIYRQIDDGELTNHPYLSSIVDVRSAQTKVVFVLKKGDTEIDKVTIAVVKDGTDGSNGKDGAQIRYRGEYSNTASYYYDDEFRDIVIYNNNKYIVVKEGSFSGIPPTNTEYWEKGNDVSFVAMDTALIDNANIAGFTFSKVDNDADGKPYGTLRSIDTNASGEPNLYMNTKTGEFRCEKVKIRGEMYSTKGTFENVTVKGTVRGIFEEGDSFTNDYSDYYIINASSDTLIYAFSLPPATKENIGRTITIVNKGIGLAESNNSTIWEQGVVKSRLWVEPKDTVVLLGYGMNDEFIAWIVLSRTVYYRFRSTKIITDYVTIWDGDNMSNGTPWYGLGFEKSTSTGNTTYTYLNGFYGVHFCTGSGSMVLDNSGGNLTVSGRVNESSDERLKDIKENLEIPLEQIANSPIIRYSKKSDEEGKTDVGGIAQYMKDILPETVTEDAQGYLSMSYSRIGYIYSVAVAKELEKANKRISELENIIKNLQK